MIKKEKLLNLLKNYLNTLEEKEFHDLKIEILNILKKTLLFIKDILKKTLLFIIKFLYDLRHEFADILRVVGVIGLFQLIYILFFKPKNSKKKKR